MADEQIKLLDLSEDIVHLVTTQLEADSPSSILELARVSRACNKLANPLIYRSIEFKDFPHMEQLLGRLLDKNDEILNFVREITISDFGMESVKFGESQILEVITNVKQLNTFK